MKWSVLAAAAIVGVSLLAVSIIPGCATGTGASPDADAKTIQPAAQPRTANTKCPVSGDEVDPDTQTVTYKGKTVGFCCKDCVEKFEKNPDKYVKNLK